MGRAAVDAIKDFSGINYRFGSSANVLCWSNNLFLCSLRSLNVNVNVVHLYSVI